MGDCCSYPGVGTNPTPDGKPNYNSYNPSEVRLYGRPALRKLVLSDEDIQNINEELKRSGLKDEDAANVTKIAEIGRAHV